MVRRRSNHPSAPDRRLIAVAALIACLASPAGARAGTLLTPPLLVPSVSSLFWCALTNISNKPIVFPEGRIFEVVNQDGAVVGFLSGALELPPGTTRGGGFGGSSVAGFTHCRAPGLSKNKLILISCTQATAGAACTPLVSNR